ncbi:hypothetical protein Tco_1384599 [Tanacetum coccineum]
MQQISPLLKDPITFEMRRWRNGSHAGTLACMRWSEKEAEEKSNLKTSLIEQSGDIATYLVEYVKFWDDWEVDRYGNANLGRKAHLLEDKQIPRVGVFDEVMETASEFTVTLSKYTWDDARTYIDDVKVTNSENPEEHSTG